MPLNVLMPALSPTMEEGTVAKWLVKVGDTIRAGDVVAEIETDKASMEVEAVDDGVVAELLVAEGAEGVKVNTPIARLARGDDAPVAAEAPPAPELRLPDPEPATADVVETMAAPPPPLAAKAVGGARTEPAKVELAEAKSASPQPRRAEAAGGVHAGPAKLDMKGTQPPPPPIAPADPSTARAFASPLARRIAEQRGLDLAQMKGSGPRGRIIKADVEAVRAIQVRATPGAPGSGVAPAAAAARQPTTLEEMGIAPGSYDLVPLDGMRKTIARRMADSFRDIPHFPLTVDIEIDAMLAARTRINRMLEGSGVKISVNDFVIKAAAAALVKVPEANASFTPNGLAMHHHADIAMAVAMPGGLITPIIRKAEAKGLAQIATETQQLAARARDKKLTPEEYQGGTFSVSNLGMFGIKTFASILNEPQGCILSVGAAEQRPVAKGEEIVIAQVMSVTLTCDHRVVDGAVGARWIAAFREMIEEPLRIIV